MSNKTFLSFNKFTVIWITQLLSLFGSGLTSFGLAVWVYQGSKSATHLSILTFLSAVPLVLILFGGGVVDRFNRRWVMVLSDAIAGATTIFMVIMFYFSSLELWHVYVAVLISAVTRAFQLPAYNAIIGMLRPEQMGRAGGMVSIAGSTNEFLAPFVAGLLLGVIGIEGIMLLDIVTFLAAVGAFVIIRHLPETSRSESAPQSFWGNLAAGWRYVWLRPGLRWLLGIYTLLSAPAAFFTVLLTPLVLSFSNERALGVASAVGGVGFFVGGLLMTVWGGGSRRMFSLFVCWVGWNFFIATAGLRESVALISISHFFAALLVSVAMAQASAVWLQKVPRELHGRVSALRRFVALAVLRPISFLAAGPLADYMTPLLRPDGDLAGSLGQIVGVGEGRGIGFILVVVGIVGVIVAIAGYANPRLRNLESEVPDAPVAEPSLAEPVPA